MKGIEITNRGNSTSEQMSGVPSIAPKGTGKVTLHFNNEVKDVIDKPKIIPPSKWHFLYWLKWTFVVKPRLIKEMNNAKAKAIDKALHSDILRERMK